MATPIDHSLVNIDSLEWCLRLIDWARLLYDFL